MPRNYSIKAIEQKKKHTNMMIAKFINAASDMILESGVDSLTIRSIANRVGCNSALLYSYFYDLEDLINYCAFKIRKPLMDSLKSCLQSEMNAYDVFMCTVRLQFRYAFQNPEMYLHLYFGKHKYSIPKTFEDYYVVFPDELESQDEHILHELQRAEIRSCMLYLCEKLADEKYIKKKNIENTAEIIVRLYEAMIYDCTIDKDIDLNKFENEAMSLISMIIKNR